LPTTHIHLPRLNYNVVFVHQ